MNTPHTHIKPYPSLSLANFTGHIVFATRHADFIPLESSDRRWFVVGIDVTAGTTQGAEVTP